ncbi:hypothetical protein [Olivibacter sitiensis]|uniref:hypothetical protein n=1 Tax=Olivibacter sitiensis TaxID=376470 RepID=UPI001FDEE396|nr:hypothetical protein [Olivibacter sitiensis]
MRRITYIAILVCISLLADQSLAQQKMTTDKNALSPKEHSLISISAFTAKGDLEKLKTALSTGLEAGLSVN